MNTELLIEEISPDSANLIVESSAESKNMFLQGIFMQGSVKNHNRRTYATAELTEQVNQVNEKIKVSGGVFGELDHPQSLNINLDRVSHVIESLTMSNNDVIGRARIIDTPMGKIAKALIESKVRLGVSSRGTGRVCEGSGLVEGFKFVTVDIVATPSAPGAIPDSIYESLESSANGKRVLTLSEQVQHDAAAQKYFIAAMHKFLNENLFAKK